MAAYDSTEFLAAVRRTAHAPSATATGWADADLLAYANAEIRQYLAPRLMQAREEFMVAASDTALVAGTAAYALPARAILGKLREVQLIASDGTEKNLPQRGPESLNGFDRTANNGTPSFYVFRGNDVVLCPTPDASAYTTLRMHYFRRLNRLVAVADVLTSTAATTTVFTGTKPSTILTSTPVDVVAGSAPFVSRGDSLTPSAVAAGSVTFGTAVTGATAGDYVCLAGESPVLQLQPEFYDLLVLRTSLALVGSGTDPEARADLAERLKEAEANLFAALGGDRNEGETEAVVSSW